MINHHFLKITLNFFSVLLLISLITAPIYFAKTFTKVSGVKSESKYLVVSQVEKFPGMVLTQRADQYAVSFTKLGPSQAYLGILILNNPSDVTQTYTVSTISGQAQLFFGENLGSQLPSISVPPATSVPISLYSGEDATAASQTIEFTIKTD